ncbi:TnsA-like heteromeric transposase endonuclease subunit [Arthrobacter sp. 135MFCol5.1]|uniref:TnsA-like heteromeric transposase endonuclease subunit n=1 Tax=Arthrobacter sp. 135MFCol5.1 TaxID=1158050 RepID=UPI000361296A|nr:TnsA-like heteromeric transposase endonuclease subunit [Arthrobacter sp. 135MFCol5.1]
MHLLKDNPFRDVGNNSLHAMLLALEQDGRRQWWHLDERIDDLDPATFSPCRRSKSYQHRRNYAGLYPFGARYDMVAFESLVELICLMELDHGGEVDAIAAQPFGIIFPDQSLHYPDFAARRHDRRIVVIDVKPRNLATGDEFVRTAVMTEEVCNTQGWEYRVMHGCEGWQAANLQWMCAFRHEEYVPASDLARKVLSYLLEPHTMEATAHQIDPRLELGIGYPTLSNMLFHRQVVPLEPGPFYSGLMIAAAEPGGGVESAN